MTLVFACFLCGPLSSILFAEIDSGLFVGLRRQVAAHSHLLPGLRRCIPAFLSAPCAPLACACSSISFATSVILPSPVECSSVFEYALCSQYGAVPGERSGDSALSMTLHAVSLVVNVGRTWREKRRGITKAKQSREQEVQSVWRGHDWHLDSETQTHMEHRSKQRESPRGARSGSSVALPRG